MLVGMGLQLVNPQILRYFIDGARSGATLAQLIKAAVAFMGIAVFQQALSVATSYIGGQIAWTATNDMRCDLAEHCIRLDMSFHKSRTPGEMIQRIDGDVEVLGSFFSNFLLEVASNALLLVGVLAMLAREDWRLAGAMTIFSIAMLMVMIRLRRVSVPHRKRFAQSVAELFGFIEERISGTEDVRANGAVPHVMRRFFMVIQKLYNLSMKAMMIGRLSRLTVQFAFLLGNLTGLGFGAYLFLQGKITIGTVFMISNYIGILQRPVMGLTFQLESLQRSSASIERVSELMNIESKLKDGSGVLRPQVPLAVRFDAVHFGYVKEESVLRDISFHLEPGRVIGLLGRTGSGKTTLTRLLFRLYDLDEGNILLDGKDIRSFQLADLRSRIGMVTQDVQIFHASIRNNLTLFDPSISDKKIREALERLGLTDWLESLPRGLDTVLDSHTAGLSAGESQLLAFTRVFLRDPGIVILDEASSRLDPATEQLIEHAVTKLLENRTGIIVAHRLGTVQRVDEIMILENGQIQEHDLRSRLAADPSTRFYALLRTGLEEAMS